ncbi:50S ribosomal protein L25 [Buchnera aphidicola]|uniref:50S ribosomal protein L25 n=1 Tax=Buchnera aphidicola TaxID=9 RepID=UPI0030EC33C5
MIVLNGLKRKKSGTQNSRRLRLTENFPSIIYRKNLSSILISLNQNELLKIYDKIDNFKHKKFQIKLKKKNIFVKILEIQFHSFKHKFLHIDFLFLKKII